MAAALYKPPPSAEELAAWGMKPADFDHEVIEVWPENEPAFHLFQALCTQWRVGMGGPTGLDHNVLIHRLSRMGLDAADYDQLDADVRHMESAALETMAEHRSRGK